MKNFLKNKESGITLITLTVAVTILILLSAMLVYNAKNGIKLRTLKFMQNDIEMLDNKVNSYYIKYGKLPVEYEYLGKMEFEPGPNDSEKYYLIDIDVLDGLTLNYGADYNTVKSALAGNSTITGIYDDIYIINEQSHHIYYVKGVNVDGVMYYTNDVDDEVSTKIIPKLYYFETSEKNVKLVLNVINGSNMSYTYKIFVNGQPIKTGETSDKRVEADFETVFDEEYRAYAEIEYDGNTVVSGDISKEDLKIANLNELKSFRDKVNSGKTYEGKTIKQVANIDLGGASNGSWTPIGTESKPFKGTYDTEDNTISNIYINNTQAQRQGLFGYITGTLKNIGIESGTINSGSFTGAIVGYSNGGTIEDCYNKATINGVGDCISGICGYANNSTIIRRCYNAGNVTGTANNKYQVVAGISGMIGKSIEECYNTGNITENSNYANCRAVGISDKFAMVDNNSHQINSCYNTGIIKITQTGSSTWAVASGIVGQAGAAGTSLEIINCYNAGMIELSQEYSSTFAERKTAILGCSMSDNTTIKNCYYLSGTAPYERGRNTPDKYPEIVGNAKSESEMKKLASTLGSAFKDDINNINKGYPILSWQKTSMEEK